MKIKGEGMQLLKGGEKLHLGWR